MLRLLLLLLLGCHTGSATIDQPAAESLSIGTSAAKQGQRNGGTSSAWALRDLELGEIDDDLPLLVDERVESREPQESTLSLGGYLAFTAVFIRDIDCRSVIAQNTLSRVVLAARTPTGAAPQKTGHETSDVQPALRQ